MDASCACNDLFDRLTLIRSENDSVASERALQVSRAHRRECAVLTASMRAAPGELAHENNAAHEAGALQSCGLDRAGADRGYDSAHPDAKQNEQAIKGQPSRARTEDSNQRGGG
jgi:hypothetical protein